MKKIELYETWLDRKGNFYPPGTYDIRALPKEAQKIDSSKGRIIDPNSKEKSKSEKPERVTTTNNTLRQITQETSKPKPQEPKKEDYTEQDLTPKKKRTPKTTKSKTSE